MSAALEVTREPQAMSLAEVSFNGTLRIAQPAGVPFLNKKGFSKQIPDITAGANLRDTCGRSPSVEILDREASVEIVDAPDEQESEAIKKKPGKTVSSFFHSDSHPLTSAYSPSALTAA